MIQIGERLRELRLKAGLSVDELAIRAGLTSMCVYQIEGGRTTPSLRTAAKLARGLGLSLGEFDECVYQSPKEREWKRKEAV